MSGLRSVVRSEAPMAMGKNAGVESELIPL